MSNAESQFHFTRDYVIYEPKPQGVYPISQGDWERLKRQARRFTPIRRPFEILSSVCFGVFASAILSLIAFYATPITWAPWVLPTAWTVVVGSVLLGVAFEMLFRQQHRIAETTVTEFLAGMAEIEESFHRPQ